MSKIKSLLLFFLALAFSCKGKEPAAPVSWSLESSGEKLSLALDDQTPEVSMELQYFPAANPLLFNVNQNANSLQVFDQETQTQKKELVFALEGDQRVRLGHFHAQSLDSIFIFSEIGPEYSMIFPHYSYYITPPQINP